MEEKIEKVEEAKVSSGIEEIGIPEEIVEKQERLAQMQKNAKTDEEKGAVVLEQIKSGLFLPIKIQEGKDFSFLIQKVANAFQTIVCHNGKFYTDILYVEVKGAWTKEIVFETTQALLARAKNLILELKKLETKETPLKV